MALLYNRNNKVIFVVSMNIKSSTIFADTVDAFTATFAV